MDRNLSGETLTGLTDHYFEGQDNSGLTGSYKIDLLTLKNNFTSGFTTDITSLSTAISGEISNESMLRYSTDMSLSTSIVNMTGAVTYKGTWDARTVSEGGSGIAPVSGLGYYYIVNISGSTPLTGVTGVITGWKVGDWAVNDGTYWDKINNSDPSLIASAIGYTNIHMPLVSNVEQALDSGITYVSNLDVLLAVPSTVGGIISGTLVGSLTGKTFTQMFDSLLFPTVLAYIGTPAKSLSISGPTTASVDVGSQYTPSVTTAYNAGVIRNGDGTLGPNLVGPAWLYTFRLPSLATDGTPNGTSTHTYTTTTIPLETSYQWSVIATYSGGTGVYYDNKGNPVTNLDGSRVAGTITAFSGIVTGYNRRYWGTSATAVFTLGSEVTGLSNNELSSTRVKTFDIDFNGEYLYYCYPSRMGLATFTVGGFGVGFVLTTMSVTNSATVPYTETFNIYRSPSTQAPGMKHIIVT